MSGILDPKTPANRQTGCPGLAMQFVAAGHKTRIGVLSSEEFGLDLKKIRRNLEIQRKFRGSSEEVQRKFRGSSDLFRGNLDRI